MVDDKDNKTNEILREIAKFTDPEKANVIKDLVEKNSTEKKFILETLEKIAPEKYSEVIEKFSDPAFLKARIECCRKYLTIKKSKLEKEIKSWGLKTTSGLGEFEAVFLSNNKNMPGFIKALGEKYNRVCELWEILDDKQSSVLEKNFKFTYKFEIEVYDMEDKTLAEKIAEHRNPIVLDFLKGICLVVWEFLVADLCAPFIENQRPDFASFFQSAGKRELVNKLSLNSLGLS